MTVGEIKKSVLLNSANEHSKSGINGETAIVSMTFEEAKAEQDELDPGKRLDPDTPLFQWYALQELEQLRERYESGDKYALMLTIRLCANHGMVLPEWAAGAYIKAFDTVNGYRSKSWDEVLGNPLPKGANLNAKKKKRELQFAVLLDVQELSKDNPIDESLFERVGAKFNIGKTLASEYYYSIKGKLIP